MNETGLEADQVDLARLIESRKSVFFISKDANWQRYRNDIFQKMAREFFVSFKILTIGKVREYLKSDTRVEYIVHHSWLPLTWKPSFFPGALLQIMRDRPDIVLCMANMSQMTELAALPLCKMLGIRFVWWTHGYDHDPVNNRISRFVKRKLTTFCFKKADVVITFSDSGRDYVIKQGVAPSRVICAPNTLNTDHWLDLAEDVRKRCSRQEVLADLGLDINASVVLFSGRLLASKRIVDALWAVKEACQKVPGVYLLIIGDGPDRVRLEQIAGSVLPGHCIFIGEVFDEEQLSKIFSIAEVFLLPGFVGLAIVHAFCFGVPLITERVKNHSPEIQYLHDGYNGFFVDVGDIDGLASRLLELLTDAEKWKRMSQNALETICQEANIDLMIRQMALALELQVKTT